MKYANIHVKYTVDMSLDNISNYDVMVIEYL